MDDVHASPPVPLPSRLPFGLAGHAAHVLRALADGGVLTRMPADTTPAVFTAPDSAGASALAAPAETREIPSVDGDAPDAAQTDAVRVALDRYQAAYERLDAAAAASIWPTVDRGALTRAFSALESQGLAFDACDILVADAAATARCRGSIQVVRKVGSPDPLTVAQEWVFNLQRSAEGWQIQDVSAGGP
jgi:hypothetical protein